MNDLASHLRGAALVASAPGRLDCGGSLDLRPFALLTEFRDPLTVNIALEVRAAVVLRSYASGRILIDGDAVRRREFEADHLSFVGSMGLVVAILSHFGISGVRLTIRSRIPRRSGLGGSQAISVATIAAISWALADYQRVKRLSRAEIAWRAHVLEDSVAGWTGLQDGLAASYGGVNKWTWTYGRQGRPYERTELLRPGDYHELEKRIVVAFTGEERDSNRVSALHVRGLLAGRTWEEWMKVRRHTQEFAACLHRKDWSGAIRALRRAGEVQDRICPNLWNGLGLKLRSIATRRRCAVVTAGGNRAGCVWAFGHSAAVREVREEWAEVIGIVRRGALLPGRVSAAGVIVKEVSIEKVRDPEVGP